MELCKICGVRKRTNRGKGILRTTCSSCHTKPWVRQKKDYCEACGFKAIHTCQLDVDHKDGDKNNHNTGNLITLCSNCHRLKTHMSKDHLRPPTTAIGGEGVKDVSVKISKCNKV